MKFVTESGSEYEIAGKKVRRINEDRAKRADGLWVELLDWPRVEIGERVRLVMAGLSAYGSDDYGNSGPVTVRTTTPVVRIE